MRSELQFNEHSVHSRVALRWAVKSHDSVIAAVFRLELIMKLSHLTFIALATLGFFALFVGFTWFQHARSNLVLIDAAIDYEFDSVFCVDGAASFANSDIDDERLISLVPHFRNHLNFTTLDLSDTRISDYGIGYLRNLPKLRTVDVRNTNVTDAGISDARQFLPVVDFKY